MSLLTDWRDAVRDHKGLDTSTVAVGMVLSTYMSGDGRAYPSRRTIADGAKMVDARSADRAIRLLEEAGLLKVRRSKGRRSNEYLATVPPDALLNGAAGCTVAEANSASGGSQQCIPGSPTVQPTAPESIESEIESPGALSQEEQLRELARLQASIGHRAEDAA